MKRQTPKLMLLSRDRSIDYDVCICIGRSLVETASFKQEVVMSAPQKRSFTPLLVSLFVFCASSLLFEMRTSVSFLQAKEQTTPKKVSTVDFSKDVFPILETHCLDCHGADAREGGLRLNNRRDAFSVTDSGVPAIHAGSLEKSSLYQRLVTKNVKLRMPLELDPLSKSEIETIRKWIEEGANWPQDSEEKVHWAYVKPMKAKLPEVKNKQWTRNPIDVFILKRLEEEGLSPSPQLDRARLIRRLSLALTGLPPTVKEVEQFVNDSSSSACEQLVDRPARFSSVWRTLGASLARSRSVCRFQRLSGRPVERQLGLPRLGDSGFQ